MIPCSGHVLKPETTKRNNRNETSETSETTETSETKPPEQAKRPKRKTDTTNTIRNDENKTTGQLKDRIVLHLGLLAIRLSCKDKKKKLLYFCVYFNGGTPAKADGKRKQENDRKFRT